jgi:hypothetical protein
MVILISHDDGDDNDANNGDNDYGEVLMIIW